MLDLKTNATDGTADAGLQLGVSCSNLLQVQQFFNKIH